MGCTPHITADRFPRQGMFLGLTVEVCFDYDTSATIRGKVIRADAEEPGRMIILLDNGWAVLSTECQYRFPKTDRTTLTMDAYEKQLAAWRDRTGFKEKKRVKQTTAKLPVTAPPYAPAIAARHAIRESARRNRALGIK
jgi:hypothetical protein